MSTVFEAFNGMNRPNVPQNQNADMFNCERDAASGALPGKNGADCSAPSSIPLNTDVLFSLCGDI